MAVASGTDDLLIDLSVLGVLAVDEVTTIPRSCIDAAVTTALPGAVPVYVNIDPATYNLDLSKLEEVITEHTRAIIPVTLYG